ncbi:Rho-GTPase-activating protein 8 [Malassezia vespertilionis]|uniref:Rho-GAP domain-containing protein n=1 Tax=Malassezia vespertilionis TaxID=2020962 RepID=A0A2N1JCZ1_9BASI|nr:Rho-GTPase-activating protein 8 [Malassezia vespertilionis]PKI84418.1 hypothetical protein MVES_001706 [Malassezia vespertilionis]WFD06460.1 Rho-GTPase-activating protein 8 [Malassezia vespertilionis]
MTSPSQLDIAHPSTFATSFWTHPEYRTGAMVLYARMQDGLDENETVLSVARHRAQLERDYGHGLESVPELVRTRDELFPGASDKSRVSKAPSARALRLLVHEAATTNAAQHYGAAKSLESNVILPFTKWADAHEDRIYESWDVVNEALCAMERHTTEVTHLQMMYESKCRQADEAEEDVQFAPGGEVSTPPRTANHTKQLSLTPTPPAHTEKEDAPLDTQKLERRATLRQQFGFKARPENTEHEQLRAEAAQPNGPSLRRSASRLSLSQFTKAVGSSSALAQVRAAVSGLADPRHIRLRRDAETAEWQYSDGVLALDAVRCRTEETLFHHYQLLQRWESERIVALQRVLTGFSHALNTDVEALRASDERMQLLPRRVVPAAHFQYLISEFRTGPFRPAPVSFKPYYHDEVSATAGLSTLGFGIDLVALAKGAALAAEEQPALAEHGKVLTMPTLPPILHALLSALQRSYADKARWLATDGSEPSSENVHAEKRRIWLYDVPLHVTHALRTKLIEEARAQSSEEELWVPDQLLDSVDAPVLAATVKLWALELHTPLLPHSFWDEVAEIYDASAIREETLEKARTEDADRSEISRPVLQGISGVLARLPKLHLTCLDAIIAHLYKLMRETSAKENTNVYTSKLGLALGRCILRPSTERPSTLQAKYPALLVKDFVEHYETLFPPLMLVKAKESDAYALSPFRSEQLRRRSTLVDQRIKRSSLQSNALPTVGLQRRAAQFGQLHNGRAIARHASVSYRTAKDAPSGLSLRTARSVSAQVPGTALSPVRQSPLREQSGADEENVASVMHTPTKTRQGPASSLTDRQPSNTMARSSRAPLPTPPAETLPADAHAATSTPTSVSLPEPASPSPTTRGKASIRGPRGPRTAA